MNLDDVITHPYRKEIEKMCMDDEPVNKIVNWVKNTVDTDDKIAADQKEGYYLTFTKINNYKKVLRERTSEMMVKVAQPKITVGNVVDPATVDPAVLAGTNSVKDALNDEAMYKAIISKDADKGLINLSKTIDNLAKKIEARIERIEMEQDGQIGIDVDVEKSYRGYLVELRNLLKDFSEITGYKDFYKKLGEQMGQQAASNTMDKKKKAQLKEFARKLLSEVDKVDLIPTYLKELEEVIGG